VSLPRRDCSLSSGVIASRPLGKAPLKMVHRGCHKFVWAALIGVLIQIAAPVWAVSALAASPLDPIADAPVCSEHSQLDGKGAPQHRHAPLCPICQILCHAVYAVVPSPPDFTAPANISWVSHLRYSIPEPRGPPSVFAQPRAPPSRSDMRATAA
jgi:hypothetical protein